MKFSGDSISVPLDQASPLALIIAELLSNSLKHAFPKGRKGVIRITTREARNEQLELTVVDDGIGLPRNYLKPGKGTLGLSLVTGLVENQLRGKLAIKGGGAATNSVRWKKSG